MRKILSHEWLWWNPETIDAYPDETEEARGGSAERLAEPPTEARRRTGLLPRVLRELASYVAAGVVAGLVSAIVLVMLVLALPDVAKREAFHPVSTPPGVARAP